MTPSGRRTSEPAQEAGSTLVEMGTSLRNGAVTSRALVEQAIERADDLDERLGVYLARFDQVARATADVADSELAEGTDRGPLHGIPIGIKDVICTAEGPTTGQSLVPPPHGLVSGDAVVVERLRQAGAVVLGKTTTMEHAIGFPHPEAPFPLPRNPWSFDRWPGGSSSGSAAGVAAGLFPIALGTDTCGSIRLPAAFCGATGLRPTYGLVPTIGCASLSPSMDTIGPLAGSAIDCALVLSAIADVGADPLAAHDRQLCLDGTRIGVATPGSLGNGDDRDAVEAFDIAVAELDHAGAVISEVTLPRYAEASAAALLTAVTEGAALHQHLLQARWSDYYPSTRELFSWGAMISGIDYVQAQRARSVARRELTGLFQEVDVVLMPTVTIGAPTFEEIEAGGGPMALSGRAHTFYWNAVDNPVLAFPIGADGNGLPLGAQLAGRPNEEYRLIGVAAAFQARTTWHVRQPTAAARRG